MVFFALIHKPQMEGNLVFKVPIPFHQGCQRLEGNVLALVWLAWQFFSFQPQPPKNKSTQNTTWLFFLSMSFKRFSPVFAAQKKIRSRFASSESKIEKKQLK